MSNSDEQLLVLMGGFTIAVEPWRLLLELEERGLRIARVGDALRIGPQEQLTPDDRRRIARWRADLLALLAYEPPALAQ